MWVIESSVAFVLRNLCADDLLWFQAEMTQVTGRAMTDKVYWLSLGPNMLVKSIPGIRQVGIDFTVKSVN